MKLKGILMAVMLLFVTGSAYAAVGPTLNFGSVSGVAGQTVTIPVTLTNNGASIALVGFDIGFVSSALTPTGATPGPAATAASKSVSASLFSPGVYRVAVAALNNTAIGDGVVANVTFTIAANFTGTSLILTNTPSAADPNGNTVAITGSGATITLPDTVAPVVTAFTIPATAASQTVSISAFSATDNAAVTGYLVTESATTPLAGASGWSATPPASYTVAGTLSQGVATLKTLYAWAKDAAGNVSLSQSAQVTITLPDTIAPTVTAFTIPGTSTTLTVPVSTFTATDNLAVTGFLVTESATAPLVTDAGWSATAPASYLITSTVPQGVATSTTLYAWAKDAAGNVSLSKSASVVVTIADAFPPVLTAFTVPATSTSQTVTISSLTATDNVGVTGYLVTESATAPLASAAGWSASAPTSYTVAGTIPQAVPTGKTLYAWAKDAAGNVSTSLSQVVTITLPDTVAPVVTAFTIPASSSTQTVSISNFSATDNVAVTGYLVTESATPPAPGAAGWSASAPSSYTVAGSIPQGVATSKTLYAWAKDAAGNVSAVLSKTVVITLNGPTLTFTSTLADGTSTKNPALTLAGSVTGNGSPVASLTLSQNGAAPAAVAFDPNTGAFSTPIVLATGANTLVTVATDQTGSATTDTRVITLNPNLADLNVTAPASPSFIKTSMVTVTGSVGAPQTTTVTIALNGAAAVVVPLTGDNFSLTLNPLATGLNQIVVTATDTFTGAHTQTLSVTSDLTAPTLSVTAPASTLATAKSSVVLSGIATDAEIVSVTVTVNGVAPASQPVLDAQGNFSVTIALPAVQSYAILVTATDQSGNVSTVQRNVIRSYPSGSVVDGVSAPTLADALQVLNFALGLGTPPTADQIVNVDVAPLVNGKPAPDGVVDGGDVLVILEKIVGTVAW